jgi:hypothetical protein
MQEMMSASGHRPVGQIWTTLSCVSDMLATCATKEEKIVIGCVISLDKINKGNTGWQVMFFCIVSSVLRTKSPLQHPRSGVPPNWKYVPCSLSRWNACPFITELKILEQTSMSITPHHLFGSERSPTFGTGTHWL